MLLYHGTDRENAIKICNEQRVNQNGLWCANSAQIALGYGNTLVCIDIPEGNFGAECYPLSTGKLTDTIDWSSEPMEILLSADTKIVCYLVQ